MSKLKIIRSATDPQSLNTFCKGMLRELSKNYEVVALASSGVALETVEIREGVRTISVQMERHISLWKDMMSLFILTKVFYKEKPYLVHSMTPKAGLLCMIAAWLVKVPVRVHTFTGLIFPTASGLLKMILMWTDRLTCACATHIIPEGEGVKNDLIYYHITKKPLKVLGYGNVRGVDLEYYNLTSDVRNRAIEIKANKEDLFTFIFVGRIVRDKGINELADAFNRLNTLHPKTRLILLGPFEDNLDPITTESYTIFRNNNSIELVGIQSDVRPWLAAADCLVFPSYREGFPNVVLEAGAMGLACIVTNINGSNEIIISGENGEIIPPRDGNALFEKMKDWVENPGKVAYMANKARNLVESRYEQKLVWNALFSEYKRLEKEHLLKN